MLLTSQITQGAVKLPSEELLELANKSVTISNTLIIHLFVFFGVFMLLTVGACLFAYKHKGNAGGALMAFIMGAVSAIIGQSGGALLSNILQIGSLTTTNETVKCLIASLLTTLCIAAVDFGFRFYLMFYLDKTGIGKFKATSVACGYIVGTVAGYIPQMLSSALAAININKGTFIPQTAFENADLLEQYVSARDGLAEVPVIQYYGIAAMVIGTCAIHVFLSFFLTKGWLCEQKGKYAGIAAAVTVVFNLGLGATQGISMGETPFVDLETGMLITIIYFVFAGLLAAFFTYKTLLDFPKGREKFIKSAAQQRSDAEERKKRSTWAQVNAINARNFIAEADEAPESAENAEPAETAENSGKTDN